MELTPLRIERKGLRATFTLCANKIEVELAKEKKDVHLLSVFECQLKDKFERLNSCQEAVSSAILQTEDCEKTFAEDLQAAEEYRDRYYEIISRIESSRIEESSHRDVVEKRQFKLPKIELKKFNGEAREYLAFWAQFEKIHNDESLPDEDKFQYLLQAVVPKSKAARVVESFPATAANYPKAVKQLQERFGREDLLVQIYVRDLLSMVMKNAISGRVRTDFPTLYDELEGKLRALESLGRTQEKYSDFLIPLVESCLPENILVAWERHRNSVDPSKNEDRSLAKLMTFLSQEVKGEEMVVLARSGFGANQNIKKKEPFIMEKSPEIPSATALVSMANQENTGKSKFCCLFCDKSHPSQECFMARKLTLDDKRKILIKRGACFSCLRLGHVSRTCKFRTKCMQCNRNHYILMCPDRETGTNENKAPVVDSKVLANNCEFETVLLMTLVVKIKAHNYERKIRAVLDTGSQRSYLSGRIVKDIKLNPKRKQKLIHGLFGGRKTEPRLHEVYDIRISNLDNTFSLDIEVLSEDKICGFISKANDILTLQELKNRNLIIPDLSITDFEIDLLLGSDVAGLIMTGNSMKLKSGLFVIETNLGNTLVGKEDQISKKYNKKAESMLCESNLYASAPKVVTLHSMNLNVNKLWDLDAIGITDPYDHVKNKLKFADAVEKFKADLTVLPNGRYELLLPFKYETQLPNNKNLSLKRHKKMCQRAVKENYLKDYIDVFNEWESLGIIEKVPDKEINQVGHYLPHRPVFKQSSQTSKIRPVFDASAKEGNLPSLNDCLIKGPNLIQLIPDLIDRFRQYPIGLSSDIEKAFLQMSIAPEHRDFLRFFFPSETEEIVYRHCRVVFGVSTSPFLLMASLNHLLEKASEEFSDVVSRMRHSFYVDNCITGVSTLEELEYFIPRAQKLLASACFNLRRWEGNSSSTYLSKTTGDTSLLGMIWNLDEDTLRCSVPTKLEPDQCHTKRTVLSITQQIFDPLGLLCPATLLSKLLMQETWKIKLNWDNPLPPNIQKEFARWLNEIPDLNEIEINRYLRINETSELHVFVDACKKSYGACIFMRTETSHGVKVQLLRAKSRVAPIKNLTVPKLELMACCIGSRLAHSVRLALDLAELKITLWSDSMVALWWIKEHGEWSIFVANRVKEIRQLTSPECWRYVPGNLNPADLISRGCFPKRLAELQWWKGPSWLLESSNVWPASEVIYEPSEVEREKRKIIISNIALCKEDSEWYAKRYSNFHNIIRLIAWMKRFVNNCRRPVTGRIIGELSAQEMEESEKTLIRIVQAQAFQKETIPVVNTFIDQEGIIRVKTRITERSDEMSFLYPILLPGNCAFTRRLVECLHLEKCHAGSQILLNIIREKYWIIQGRKLVRSLINSCMKCRRYKAKNIMTTQVTLPEDRVKNASAFEVVGVDFAGPLFLKEGVKAWIVLFTCAIYRAIHLELVTSLSTDSFLLSLRRFISRRGRPQVIYCDNGTNFKGAHTELKKIDWNSAIRYSAIQRITWRFNPPTAAWWGGWWERLVRVVKELLRRSLGKASLNYEELITVLCDCEAVINSRPLTYLSEDPEDLIPLTPLMFLLDKHSTEVLDIDIADSQRFERRIRYRTKLLQDLRQRFRKEYLGLLVEKQNKLSFSRKLEVGEIVLVGDDFQKRLHWPLARVIELIPGKDGRVRVVKLKTRTGTLVRPVQRVYPLEMEPILISNPLPIPRTEENEEKEPPSRIIREKVTRSGRVIKVPQKLDLFNQVSYVFESPQIDFDSKRGEDVTASASLMTSLIHGLNDVTLC